MRKLRTWLINYWQIVTQFIISLFIAGFFLFFRLWNMTSGFSLSELEIHNNLKHHLYKPIYLWQHLINAPYTIGLLVLGKLNFTNALAIRSIGAFFGLLTVFCFYYVIRRWHNTLIALLITSVFTLNFWFLLTTRFGQTDSLYPLSVLLVLILAFIIRRLKSRSLNELVVILIAGLLIYIPGIIWFITIGLIWQWSYLTDEFSRLSLKLKSLYTLIFLAILAPLAISIFQTPSNIKLLLGLPLKLIGIKLIGLNVLHSLIALFARNTYYPSLSLGHQPILGIFTIVMLVIGVYHYITENKHDRLMLILGGIFLGIILSSLGGTIPLAIILPFVYILIASGISYLINIWFVVFPRNPVARTTGVVLIILLVASVLFYHYNQFFVAWPHTEQTIQTYSLSG